MHEILGSIREHCGYPPSALMKDSFRGKIASLLLGICSLRGNCGPPQSTHHGCDPQWQRVGWSGGIPIFPPLVANGGSSLYLSTNSAQRVLPAQPRKAGKIPVRRVQHSSMLNRDRRDLRITHQRA